jgi:hypothetical protein
MMSFVAGARWAERGKDAGSAHIGDMGATEDAASLRASVIRRHKVSS